MKPKKSEQQLKKILPGTPAIDCQNDKSSLREKNDSLTHPLNRQRWLGEVFGSPPRRDVRGRSRPTQRFIFEDTSDGSLIVPEGGNEMTTAILLRYLKNLGKVLRYKFQPFNINEISPGIDATPDVLVELSDKRIFVLEIKAKRFLDEETLQKIEINRKALQEHGLPYLLWTDRDSYEKTNKIHRGIWTNTREIYRGWALTIEQKTQDEISQTIKSRRCILNDLLNVYGWDIVIAAFARGIFYINLQKVINEDSKIETSLSDAQWEHFFTEGNAAKTWWDSLQNFRIQR